MQRITITIEDDLLAEIDAAAKDRGYQNRSEIIRDLARAGLQQSAQEAAPSGQCVAALVYVYDHAARDLSKRLVQNFHGHHDLSLATLHVHLDDDSCMEVTALKGASSEVQHFADTRCRTRVEFLAADAGLAGGGGLQIRRPRCCRTGGNPGRGCQRQAWLDDRGISRASLAARLL